MLALQRSDLCEELPVGCSHYKQFLSYVFITNKSISPFQIPIYLILGKCEIICRSCPFPIITLFPKGEWNISVLHHMKDLTLHCDSKQHHPIEKKDRPKHWHIEHTEECHAKSNAECFNYRIPAKDKTE